MKIGMCFECGIGRELFKWSYCRDCFAKIEKHAKEVVEIVESTTQLEDFIKHQKELDRLLGKPEREYCGQKTKGQTDE